MFTSSTQILLCVSHSTTEQEKLRKFLGAKRNCVFVSSEKEAHTLLKSRLRPSLILLDAELPGKSAYDFFTKLKSKPKFEDIPVIFFLPEDSYDEAYCLSIGAADVIKHPYTLEVLEGRVDKVLSSQFVNDYLISKVYSYQDSLAEEHKKLVCYTKQIVEALSSAIDAKDTYTKGHSMRVAEYSCAIGKRMGLDDKMLEVIYQAGLLHDIGKIGISDTVLRKPGELNEAEAEAIRNHPSIGYSILSSISEIPLISLGAKYHHERFDGKGYPEKLKGSEIPLIARIICVADAYDAMTSDRSYRRSLEPEVARDEIKRCRGTQFDPEIADIAVELIDMKIKSDKSEKKVSASLISFTSMFAPDAISMDDGLTA